MKLFNFENFTVSLSKDEAMLHPFIRSMLTLEYNKGPKDTDGRKRLRALREFTYVYLMHDYASTYRDMSETERKSFALRDADLPLDYVFSKELQTLCEMYVKLNEDGILSLRILRSVQKSAEQLINYFEAVDFTKLENEKPVYSAKDYMDIVSKIPNLLASLKNLEIQVKSDLSSSGRLYADSKKGYDEDA